jgi:alpha-glucosidase
LKFNEIFKTMSSFSKNRSILSKILNPLVGMSILFTLSACTRQSSCEILSPGKKIRVSVTTATKAGELVLNYSVSYNDAVIISGAPLGIRFSDGSSFQEDMKITDLKERIIDETYTMPFGKSSSVRSHCNEAMIDLSDRSGKKFSLVFRVFDDGIGFRYVIPEQEHFDTLEIASELTSFRFDGDHKYWGLHLNSYRTAYEKEYTVDVLSEIPSEDIIGLPVLIRKSEDIWLALTEAELVNYAGMYVKSASENSTTLVAALSPRKDDRHIAVRAAVPFTTPWRVMIIGNDPGRLVESNIVLNLNEPCSFDYSWVKPGLAIDDWNNDQTVKSTGWEGAMDNRTMKHFIEFCGDYGLQYMSIDAGWYGADWLDTTLDLTRPIPEIDIPMLVSYARERNVGIFLWTLSAVLKKQLDEAVTQFNDWGIKGFNTDFFDSDDQETVNLVNRITRTAAEHKLMVEFHGIYKPTGLSRTYPNLLAHEAALGLEYSKWDRKPTPEHNCILPFTRMLAGPMDYIVTGFTNKTEKDFEIVWDEFNALGTRCHHLAQLVIFETGFQVLGDYPDNYRNNTGSELFRDIPAGWDETKALMAKVGDYVTIARRKGDQWFVGSITDWSERSFTVPLDFLSPGQYNARIFADGPDAAVRPTDITISLIRVTRQDSLAIHMAPGGGQIVHLVPAKVESNGMNPMAIPGP